MSKSEIRYSSTNHVITESFIFYDSFIVHVDLFDFNYIFAFHLKIFFLFQLYRKNGKPYVTTSTNSVNVVIQLKNEQVACTKQLDSEDAEQNAIKTSFTVHKSGAYKISVMVSGRHVKGSPFTKTFEPGEEIERIPVLFYECCKMSKNSSKKFLETFLFHQTQKCT